MRIASKTKVVSAIVTLAAIIAASITPGSASPVPSATIAVKTAAPDALQDVYWRRGGGAFVAGVAAGAMVFAPRYYGYGPGYGYGPAYGYGPGYGYVRAYPYAPAYRYYGAPYAYRGPVAPYGYGHYGPGYYGPIYYGDGRTRQQRQRDRSHGN